MSDFYSFNALDIRGKEVSLQDFKGKVVLVVNTASKCGLTPQYKGLEELYRKYKDRGLVILGFPCNQFAGQEPDDEASISQTCLINYGVSFPMFSKIDVNGEETHPLFGYLKSELKGFGGSRIKWNFTKFLVDREGKATRRFAPTAKPESLEKHIQRCLEMN